MSLFDSKMRVEVLAEQAPRQLQHFVIAVNRTVRFQMGVEGIEPPVPRASVVCFPTKLHSHVERRDEWLLNVFRKCEPEIGQILSNLACANDLC